MVNKLIAASLLIGTALSSIQVLHPKELKSSLKNEGVIKSSLGNFGHVLYGTSVVSGPYLKDLAWPCVLPSFEH